MWPLAAYIAVDTITNSKTWSVGISADNLPTGNFWEADGACWQYERDAADRRGYRLKPMNVKAFAKTDGPEGPMTDFYPVVGT